LERLTLAGVEPEGGIATMPDDAEIERRIREKAHQLWEQEGRPEGRAGEHWDRARILVAIEDDRTGLVPVAPKPAEEAELQENLGEFPTALTDQGDRRPTPSVKSERAIAQDVGSRLRSAFKRKRSGTSK
jgi:hypothetical protein